MEISQSTNTDAGNLNTKQYNKTLKSEANRKNKTIKKIRKESEIEINQEQDRLNNKKKLRQFNKVSKEKI